MNFTLVRIENGRTLCTDMQTHEDKYIGIGASFKAKVWKTRRGVESFLDDRPEMRRFYRVNEVQPGMWK